MVSGVGQFTIIEVEVTSETFNSQSSTVECIPSLIEDMWDRVSEEEADAGIRTVDGTPRSDPLNGNIFTTYSTSPFKLFNSILFEINKSCKKHRK